MQQRMFKQKNHIRNKLVKEPVKNLLPLAPKTTTAAAAKTSNQKKAAYVYQGKPSFKQQMNAQLQGGHTNR